MVFPISPKKKKSRSGLKESQGVSGRKGSSIGIRRTFAFRRHARSPPPPPPSPPPPPPPPYEELPAKFSKERGIRSGIRIVSPLSGSRRNARKNKSAMEVIEPVIDVPRVSSSLSMRGDRSSCLSRMDASSCPTEDTGDRTEPAGNLTSENSSLVLTSLVCLSLLELKKPRATASSSRVEVVVQESLRRHMNFHLSRCFDDFDDDTSSIESFNKSMSADRVHTLARTSLARTDVTKAISFYEGLLVKQRKKADAQKADTLSRLAVLCLMASRSEEAMLYSIEALELHRGNVRPLHASVCIMELGLVHFYGNDLSRSLKLWREAMQMSSIAMGYDHPYVAVLLNNIGVLHHESGDLAGSQRALEESVELQRTSLSSSPVNAENLIHQMAATMGNLAIVCEACKQYDRAVALLQESLALYQSVYTFESDHIEDTITAYMGRLVILRQRGDGEDGGNDNSKDTRPSLLKLKQVLSSSTLGSDANSLVRSESLFGKSNNISNKVSLEASDYHDFLLLGPLAKKLTQEQRVRETVLAWFRKQVHDTKRPVSVGDKVVNAELQWQAIQSKAVSHLNNHEIDAALDIFHDALRSHRQKFGSSHHLVGRTLHNMGMIYLFARQYNNAQQAFDQAVGIRSSALGPGHPDVCDSLTKIGLLQLIRGDLAESRQTFLEIRDRHMEGLGYGHPVLAEIINNIGVVAYSHGDRREAYRCFEIACEYLRRLMGSGTTQVLAVGKAHALSNLGFVSTKEGDFVQALHFFEDALVLYRKHLNKGDPRIRIVLGNIRFLVSTGDGPTDWEPDNAGMNCHNPICMFNLGSF